LPTEKKLELHTLASALLKHETLTQDEIRAVLKTRHLYAGLSRSGKFYDKLCLITPDYEKLYQISKSLPHLQLLPAIPSFAKL